jgi:hypothetical protein
VREEGRGEGQRDGGGVVDAEVGEVLAQPARGVGERVWAGQRRAVGQLGPGPRARQRAPGGVEQAREGRARRRGVASEASAVVCGEGGGAGTGVAAATTVVGTGEQRRGGRGHGGRRGDLSLTLSQVPADLVPWIGEIQRMALVLRGVQAIAQVLS